MLLLKETAALEEFLPQLRNLANLRVLTFDKEGLSLSCKQEGEGITIVKTKDQAVITYGKRVEFFRSLATIAAREEEEYTLHENARFQFNGAMLDNSRNSVLNLKTAKEMVMYAALSGLDHILLYNEDTFEVPEDPYFGYMRMAYTKKDVRELTNFAAEFGVTIVPCIQTLAHLETTLRWRSHWDIVDHGGTMLVEEEKTYELIENIIKSWRDCVDTELIHIGMDEAFYLGRGKYVDLHGCKPKFELMCNHLKRVLKICEKYGFRAMIWSDMFFHLVFGGYYTEDQAIDPKLMELVPEDVTLVYWDYYSTTEEQYRTQMKKHTAFPNQIGFAGGAWKWSGLVPALRHSHEVSKLALKQARENGISIVFTTAWGDSGAEASIFTILPTLLLYGEAGYTEGDPDQAVSDKLKALTGYTLEEYFTLCEPNVTPTGNKVPHVNPAKYLFFQDPLQGLFDYHVREDFPAFFADCAKKLAELAQRDSKQAYLFDVIGKLCSCLELKADLGVRLKKAYDQRDHAELSRLANETIPEILARLEPFYQSFREQWYRESRTGGFDVMDFRFGGLRQRLLSAQDLINRYLKGEIPTIRELAEKRLPYDCRENDETSIHGVIHTDENFFDYIVTANVNGRF